MFKKNKTPRSKTQVNYIWWRDKKIIGTIVLILAVAFQVFAWVKIPFLSSIHGYTIGMLIGIYNPFFYFYVAFIGLILMFGNRIKLPKWFKLNEKTYWIVAILIIFISVSTSYYQSKTGYISIGAKPWSSFNSWWNDFTGGENAWLPVNTNGGVVGVFLYAFFAMITSGIGALICSIVLMVITLSYIISGSALGFYKRFKENGHIKDVFKRDKQKPVKPLETKSQPKKTDNFKISPKENKKEKDTNLPFEDPFN